MQEVTAIIGRDQYKTTVHSDTNRMIADEPLSVGGTDQGFSPEELLASALAVCSAITMRMYADRKQIAVDQIEVNVSVKWDKNINETIMIKNIHFTGNISPEEKEKLLLIASKCPTHKMLQHPVQIITSLT